MMERIPEITYVRPGKARSCTTYRFKAECGYLLKTANPSLSEDTMYHRTISSIMDWLRKKTPDLLPADGNISFRHERDGQTLEAVALHNKHHWSLRFTHPDVGMPPATAPVAGRTWTTDIAVTIKDSNVLFGVEIFASTLNPQAPLPRFVRPGIIRLLASTVGLFQLRPLSGQPWVLSSGEDLNTLEQLLTSQERTLSVIVVSEVDLRNSDAKNALPQYTVDANLLARKTEGYAHVVKMPLALSYEWTAKVGKPWSVYDGAVRTYMPELDFESDSFYSHPLAIKSGIIEFSNSDPDIDVDNTKNLYGPNAFLSFLISKIYKTMPRYTFSWAPLLFCPDARAIELSEKAKNMLGGDICFACQEIYDSQAQILQQKIRETEEKVREWEQIAVEYSQDLDFQRQQNYALRSQVDALRQMFKNSTGKGTDTELTIPGTYDVLPEWVEENLSGRLLLLPRAIRAVKDAVYQDVTLVYKCLLLLAEEYRNMRQGIEDAKNEFDQRCAELELGFGNSITKTAVGEYESTYYVNYPAPSGKKRLLDLHLTKGSTKDDKYCMRIYFFWDDHTNQVIVGSLPAHLECRKT